MTRVGSIRGSAGGSNIVELYRTTAGGTTYYKVNSTFNIYTTETNTIQDVVSDASLVSGELLYTAGGVLASQPPPPMFAITQFDRRLWGISAEDRSLLWFTSQFVDGIAPVWNEALTVRINDQFGDCTGLESMDDKLIIFKDNAVYYLPHGGGPNASGVGSYADPILAMSNEGMAEADVQSTVVMPDGIMFRAGRGLALLSRGLVISYIGQPVQKYVTSAWVTAGALLYPDKTQVRFYSTGGTTLVYDYIAKQWSVFTGQTASSAVLWGGLPTFANATNGVLVENALYTENGAAITMKVTTPWIKMGGFRGFGRLYELQGIGEYVAAHTLVVTTAYNDNPADTVVKSVAPGTNWDWACLDDRQKISTAKVTLAETSSLAGFKASGLVLLIGAKPGLNRIDPGKRAT
jgi:hypothetical protein